MTAEAGIAIASSIVAIATAILAPALIVGRYLGTIITTQAVHKEHLTRLDATNIDQGRRMEAFVRDLSRLEGRLDGRREFQEESRGHRIP